MHILSISARNMYQSDAKYLTENIDFLNKYPTLINEGHH